MYYTAYVGIIISKIPMLDVARNLELRFVGWLRLLVRIIVMTIISIPLIAIHNSTDWAASLF